MQALGGNLGQYGVAPRTHIRRADIKGIEAVVVDLDRNGGYVDVGNARALHGQRQADAADMAVRQDLSRIFFIPADHILYAEQALVQRTAQGRFIEVSRHRFALADHVFQPQLDGVHLQGRRQFVDSRFEGEDALRRAVAPVCAGGNRISIHRFIGKAEGFKLVIQRNGFVTRKSNRRRAMVSVGAGIPQGFDGNDADTPVLRGADLDVNGRLMTRRRYGHRFFAGVNHHGRLARNMSNDSRIHFHDGGLLRAEAAADARLDNPDLRFRNFQGRRDDAPHVEGNLRRADDRQASEHILIRIGPEGFHHGLLHLLGVVRPVDDDVRRSQRPFDVAPVFFGLGHEVALVVAADVDDGIPVLFRMDDDGVILRFRKIEKRL